LFCASVARENRTQEAVRCAELLRRFFTRPLIRNKSAVINLLNRIGMDHTSGADNVAAVVFDPAALLLLHSSVGGGSAVGAGLAAT
jgi:hypothetical protein